MNVANYSHPTDCLLLIAAVQALMHVPVDRSQPSVPMQVSTTLPSQSSTWWRSPEHFAPQVGAPPDPPTSMPMPPIPPPSPPPPTPAGPLGAPPVSKSECSASGVQPAAAAPKAIASAARERLCASAQASKDFTATSEGAQL